MLELADRHPLVLDEPASQVTVQAFSPSAIDLLFTVWTRRETHAEVKDSLQESIKRAFDAHGIVIPFPQISINTGDLQAIPVVLRDDSHQKSA